MARIYYAEVESITGNSYTVEIHHKTNTPTPVEVNLSAGGFELDYEGQGNTTFENTIMGSSCSFNILVESQAIFDGLTAIAESKENDYLLVIYKGQDLFWHGTIVTDQIVLPRASYQGTPSVNIKANDRLKLLSSVEFDFGTFSLPLNRERGLEIIKQIIQHNNTYTTGLYGASARYLLDSIELKAPNQPDGTLYNTSYKKESFFSSFTINDDFGESDEFIKCTDAIQQILQVFNAQILLTNGYYVIRQVENQFSASTEFNAYTKTLGALSVYTISNGINVQDSTRSCFEAIPDYTFQPAIREIKSTINKQNFNYIEEDSVVEVDSTLTTTQIGDLRYKYAKLLVALKNIKTYTQDPITLDKWSVNDVETFALFWVKNSAGEYFYLRGGEMTTSANDPNNNDPVTSVPTYYERLSHTNLNNNANTPISITKEIRLPDEEIVEYHLQVTAMSNWYVTRTVRVYSPILRGYTGATKVIYKYDYTEPTEAESKVGLQYSFNSWINDESANYEIEQENANSIATENANLSFNTTMDSKYYTGDIFDIFGVASYDNVNADWFGSVFDLDVFGLGVSASAQATPLIMAANVYEDNVKTIEGDLHTNGSIYAINSINIDSARWAFNGGTFNAQNEIWSGQWVKVAKGSINTGNGGKRYNSSDKVFSNYDAILGQIMSSHNNSGDLLMQKVFQDVQRTQNPTSDESLGLFIDYDLASESYLYNIKEIAEGGSPFNVTSDTSSVAFGATVNITLTGSYFKENSVVSISKGTLNSTTINSSEEMVLNITAIASAEAVNTCDVTIDGVTFTALWTYEIVWTAELVPGDGTTTWNTTGSMTTGEGFISFPNNGSNWAQGGWFEELPDAATTFELLFDPLREGTNGANHYGTAGLGAPVTSIPGYPTVDHGFYFASVTAIPLVNGGTSAGSLSWANGDTFKLSGTNTSGDSWDLIWTKISGGVSTQMKTQTVTISGELDFQCALLRHRKLQNIVLKYLTP